jgi:hypothetical protein
MKMEQIECSETLAFNNQTPGNYPKDYTQESKHGGSLKSRRYESLSIYLKKSDLCGKGEWKLTSAGTFKQFSYSSPLIFHSWLVLLSSAYYEILFLLFLNSSFMVHIFFTKVVCKCPH